MPRAKKQTETKTPKRSTLDLSQFRPIYTYVWRDLIDPDAPEDAKPLRVKVPTGLSVWDVNSISIDKDTTLLELWPTLAPFVVEWNVEMVNTQTGEVEPVPPPAEAGWEALYVLSREQTLRLTGLLKYGGRSVISSAAKTPEEATETPESEPASATDSAA